MTPTPAAEPVLDADHPAPDQPEAIGDGSLSLDGWAAQMSPAALDELHRRAARRRTAAR